MNKPERQGTAQGLHEAEPKKDNGVDTGPMAGRPAIWPAWLCLSWR